MLQKLAATLGSPKPRIQSGGCRSVQRFEKVSKLARKCSMISGDFPVTAVLVRFLFVWLNTWKIDSISAELAIGTGV